MVGNGGAAEPGSGANPVPGIAVRLVGEAGEGVEDRVPRRLGVGSSHASARPSTRRSAIGVASNALGSDHLGRVDFVDRVGLDDERGTRR